MASYNNHNGNNGNGWGEDDGPVQTTNKPRGPPRPFAKPRPPGRLSQAHSSPSLGKLIEDHNKQQQKEKESESEKEKEKEEPAGSSGSGSISASPRPVSVLPTAVARTKPAMLHHSNSFSYSKSRAEILTSASTVGMGKPMERTLPSPRFVSSEAVKPPPSSTGVSFAPVPTTSSSVPAPPVPPQTSTMQPITKYSKPAPPGGTRPTSKRSVSMAITSSALRAAGVQHGSPLSSSTTGLTLLPSPSSKSTTPRNPTPPRPSPPVPSAPSLSKQSATPSTPSSSPNPSSTPTPTPKSTFVSVPEPEPSPSTAPPAREPPMPPPREPREPSPIPQRETPVPPARDKTPPPRERTPPPKEPVVPPAREHPIPPPREPQRETYYGPPAREPPSVPPAREPPSAPPAREPPPPPSREAPSPALREPLISRDASQFQFQPLTQPTTTATATAAAPASEPILEEKKSPGPPSKAPPLPPPREPSSSSMPPPSSPPPSLPPHIKLLAPAALPGSPPAIRKVPVQKGMPRKKFPDAPAPQLPTGVGADPPIVPVVHTTPISIPAPTSAPTSPPTQHQSRSPAMTTSAGDSRDKLLLKVKIPTKDTVKTLPFERQQTVEEALAIIAKKLQLAQEEIKSNDFGLFVPSRGVWIESGKQLLECDFQNMDEVSFLPRKRAMVHLAMAHGRPQRPLFDYAVIVLFKPTRELQVLYQFPPEKTTGKKDPLINSVPQFCFPDKDSLDPTSDVVSFTQEESFSFALTGDDGERKLGYCRRIIGKPMLCYCLVSALQSFDLFKHILTQVVERYDSISSTDAVTEFLKAVYEKPFPLLGETFTVKVTNPFTECPESVQFTYDHDTQIETVDLQSLLQQLQPEYLITVFSMLTIERRVIFYSDNVTTLSACVQAIVALLFPLNWQHIYVPVLPPSILSYCCAPMPFVVGVLKSCIPEVHKLPMDEVLLVDLDAGKLYLTNAEDSSDYDLLPPNIGSIMVKPLRKLHATVKKHSGNQNLSAKVKEKIKREKKKLLDVFQSFFVSALANYRDHILDNGDFDKQGFVNARTPDTKAFFDNFVMTQMFERFIEERAFRNPAFNEFEKLLSVFEAQFAAKSGHGHGPVPKMAKGIAEVLKYDWNFLNPKK